MWKRGEEERERRERKEGEGGGRSGKEIAVEVSVGVLDAEIVEKFNGGVTSNVEPVRDYARVETLGSVPLRLLKKLSAEKDGRSSSVAGYVVLSCCSSSYHAGGRVLNLHLMEENISGLRSSKREDIWEERGRGREVLGELEGGKCFGYVILCYLGVVVFQIWRRGGNVQLLGFREEGREGCFLLTLVALWKGGCGRYTMI